MPVPRRDLQKTRQCLADWFAAKLPDATDLSVSELTGPGTTGFSSDTLLFDLRCRQDGEQRSEGLVARIQPTAFPVFPDYDMARQFRVQQILQKTDVPVPRVRWLEEDDGVLGAPFYVMDRVEGRIPTDNPPYHMDGWVTEIRPEERAAIWWSGLDVLTRIHRLDWEALGFGFLDSPPDRATLLDRHLDYYEHYLTWTMDGKPHPICEPALRWLRQHRPESECVRLCWGDARIGNMIFHEGRCVAALDWEMVRLGSPEEDLAWWLYLDRHHSEGVGVPALPGFPKPAETVARYSELTGYVPAHLDYYQILAGFCFSVIMARVAQQMKEYGLLPKDADFELSNPCAQLLARIMELPVPAGTG